MRILGIETSCDETGVAVYDTALAGAAGLRAHAVYSQIALHAEYGGVVPELASRDHVRKLLPLVRQTLAEAGLAVDDLDGVAYTAGPGLVGALLVGAGVARSLAWALDKPAIGVHHMEGHLLAPLMEDDPPEAAVRGAAGLRRPHAAGRGRGHRPLPAARRNPRRRGRRGLRQDRQADGPAVSGRPAAGGAGRDRHAGQIQVLAADDRSPRAGFQFQRPQDPGAAGLARQRPVRRRPAPTSRAASRTRWSIRWRSSASARWTPRAATCSWSPAASAPTSACARSCTRSPRERGGRACFPRPELCTDNGAMIAFAGALRLQAGQHDNAEVKVHAALGYGIVAGGGDTSVGTPFGRDARVSAASESIAPEGRSYGGNAWERPTSTRCSSKASRSRH